MIRISRKFQLVTLLAACSISCKNNEIQDDTNETDNILVSDISTFSHFPAQKQHVPHSIIVAKHNSIPGNTSFVFDPLQDLNLKDFSLKSYSCMMEGTQSESYGPARDTMNPYDLVFFIIILLTQIVLILLCSGTRNCVRKFFIDKKFSDSEEPIDSVNSIESHNHSLHLFSKPVESEGDNAQGVFFAAQTIGVENIKVEDLSANSEIFVPEGPAHLSINSPDMVTLSAEDAFHFSTSEMMDDSKVSDLISRRASGFMVSRF